MTDQTTPDLPVPPLTDELRRALAEADGFAFEGLEPHDYQKQAAAVRRVVARYVRADVELDVEGLEDDCCRNYGRALARWLNEDTDRAAASAGRASAPDRTALRNRIRRVLCERDGQAALWGTDMLEPDEYGADADAVLAVLPETTDRTALDRIRAMHQPVEGLGYDSDEDDTPGSYGDIAQVCSSCGTPGEYGVRWPCPTIRALDGECPQCGDAGACNGGPCPLRLADEVAVPGRADNETGETEAHPPTTTWKVESPRRDQWASWGTTYDDHDWARESYEHAAAHAHARAFRLVRATTTYTVEAVHTPAADAPAVGGAQQQEGEA